jgi:WD40 repeat protein/energy-coupling factor transporter ATP-binding protein EcfA2
MFNGSGISNPFPGLRAFEEDEDVLFFGREKQVDELLTKLRTTRFLAVIGSSGSGKSSLIKSGLIPALHSGFMSGAGSLWRICSFRPGNDPIGNVAKTLSSTGVLNDSDDPQQIETLISINESILRRSSNGLVEAYKQSGIQSKNNLLILVDQFEEIFRFSKYESDAKEGKRDSIAFINLLLKATKQTEVPVYVVFTMRSDFLSDCTEFRGLPEAINDGDYLVPRMTREERRDAITGPIAVANGKISQRLLNQLLNDVGDNPDQLPILQHSLMRTWDIWKKKNKPETEIDVTDYEEIGTMKHALSQHAEEAYAELDSDNERRICEIIFKALTDKGSDTRGIRRPSRMSELCKISNASFKEVAHVVEIFRKEGRAFLMPPANVPLTESSIIDISHESIMRVWEKLILWVEEENQSAQTYIRLCEAADLYELGNGGLWRDPELQVAWKWKEEQRPNAIWAARYNNQYEKAMLFLEHSKKEFEQELVHKENLQKRRLKQAKRVAIVISAIAVLALFLSIYSFEQKNQAVKSQKIANAERIKAEQQKKIAVEQQKIAEANKAIALQEKTAAQKSEEQAVFQKEVAERERKNAEESKKNALLQKSIAEDQKAYAERQKVIADDNARIAKEQETIAVEQKDIATKNETIAVEAKKVSTRFRELAESRNLAYQSLLLLNENNVAGSRDLVKKAYELNLKNTGPVQNSDIYNALNFNWQESIKNKNQFLLHKYPVRSITGKPGSDIIISGDESGTIILSKASNGILDPLSRYTINEEIRNLSLSPDGQRLLVLTAKGTGYLYAVDEQKQVIAQLSKFSFEGVGKSASFLDNKESVILTSAGLLRVGVDNNLVTVKESIKGDYFGAIVRGRSGKIYLADGNKINIYNSWDNVSKKPDNSYSLSSKVSSIAVDAAETYLAAGTAEGGIWVTNMQQNTTPVTLALHLSGVNDLKFNRSPDNTLQLASAGADQAIKIIDVQATIAGKTTEDALILKGHNLWVYSLYFLSDGKYLFSASEDQKIIGWIPSMSAIYDILKNSK